MTTAEELRAQIIAAKQNLTDRERTLTLEERQVDEATERQRLRRELDEINREVFVVNHEISGMRLLRREIDEDRSGRFVPTTVGQECNRAGRSEQRPVRRSEVVRCNEGVTQGEYLWMIEGMSWLLGSLKQNAKDHIEADDVVEIGGICFDFRYHPAGSTTHGTLAIGVTPSEDESVLFRYKVLVKNQAGDFVQWGEIGECCAEEPTSGWFGPDVPCAGRSLQQGQQGIFGLSHASLLKSEWVQNDCLTIRFELAVRSICKINSSGVRHLGMDTVIVLPATISADLTSLLETGKNSDVTFIIGEDSLRAHSQILSARSDVFDRILNSGMYESTSKQVIIEDCDSLIFKAVLLFIYCDDLERVAEALKGLENKNDDSGTSYLKHLQSMLVVSHKYQIMRLFSWCEQQLCERLCVQEACSILCHAHLYDAKQLESACLSFIQENKERVVVTEKFGSLSKEWPEVMLKINISLAGVSQASATPAIDAHRNAGKRKRSD